MIKPTLLEIVQEILSEMDGDEVNEIGDTIEATQVARVIRSVYYGLIEEYDLQSSDTAFQLDSANDVNKPSHMVIPAGIFDITSVRYDVRRVGETTARFKEIPYVSREGFLDRTAVMNLDDAHIQQVIDPSGIPVNIFNNGPPTFWTTLDGGRTVIFNGYDSDVESSLQQSKTQCLGQKKATLPLDSSAEVDLPETLHQLLINEAREMCFDLYKDGAPRKVAELSRRSRTRAKQRDNQIRTPADNLPDYGRRSRR